MKNIVKKTMFVLFIMGLVGIVSCKKEKQYSCDPEVHNWAKENAEKFQDITREKLATLPLPLAQAAYRTMNPEKKFEFWQKKLDIVYSQWDAPVREMIDDMRTHMSVDWFDPNADTIDKDYINVWEKTMLTEWMDSTNYVLCFCMIHTENELDAVEKSSGQGEYAWANVPSELTEKYQSAKAPPGGGGGGPIACYCAWHSTCPEGEKCIDDNCNQTFEGCGWGWLDPCKKICQKVGYEY